MKRRALGTLVAAMAAPASAACTGSTGDALYAFPAYAAGAKGAGDAFSVNGYTIKLTLAQMYVGAVYVNEAPAGSGGTFDTPVCIDPGVYAAQVPGGTEVDLLSSTPQPWTSGAQGSGSADPGLSWDIYLTDGDVNAPDNTGPNDAVDLQGTATRESDGKVFSFAATVNINQSNDGAPQEDPGQPGLDPICKQRILELGSIDLTLSASVSMLLTIDPRAWFSLPIDFSTLPSVASAPCTEFDSNTNYGDASVCIPDSTNLPGSVAGAQQGHDLYEGIFTGGSAAYSITYSSTL